jgi:c-src tyrosine kinase
LQLDGVFLVRESTNFPGDYTLCVCYQGKVEHYRVIARNNRLTIDEEEFFENLSHLVDHYKKDADGLCTQLTSARKSSENSVAYHDVDFKAFRDAGWVIDEKEITVKEKIGKGEFGDVMLGMYQVNKISFVFE